MACRSISITPSNGIPVNKATAKPWVAACAVSHQPQQRVISKPGDFSTAILSLCNTKSHTKWAKTKRMRRLSDSSVKKKRKGYGTNKSNKGIRKAKNTFLTNRILRSVLKEVTANYVYSKMVSRELQHYNVREQRAQ